MSLYRSKPKPKSRLLLHHTKCICTRKLVPSTRFSLLHTCSILATNLPSQLRKLPKSLPLFAFDIPHRPHLPCRIFQTSFLRPRGVARLSPTAASSPVGSSVSGGWRQRRRVGDIGRFESRIVDSFELGAELRVFLEEGGEGGVVEEKRMARKGRRRGALREDCGRGGWSVWHRELV